MQPELDTAAQCRRGTGSGQCQVESIALVVWLVMLSQRVKVYKPVASQMLVTVQ